MSLGVVIKGPEGIVLASDSRITLTAEKKGSPPILVNFDNATKLLSFHEPHTYVGVVTYGRAVIGQRTAHSFLPELEAAIEAQKRLTVREYAQRLSEFFLAQWKEAESEEAAEQPMMFIVGGYDPEAPYGRVFVVDIPRNPEPVEQNPGKGEFGMTWGGQLQIASRIIHGYDPRLLQIVTQELRLSESQRDHLVGVLREQLEFSIPYQILPLQDCVNLAVFMIRSTMDAQGLAIGVRGVGGPIDVAIITRMEGLKYIQQKSIAVGGERWWGRETI